ncbi:TIGR02234 family membrane protein [Mycobacteroides abscessus]|uniref:TIGR02234 family membrane protein n=1 Tax=Mycobacteroides abscessus TaxID=36809 RepID=UPI0009A5A490|nr:TIGR02234 family membrane protein [Mycobacteroides abscessus]MDM2645702.1 TIGR02234 family membrane protein [Mycobacteroides abscessus]MDM2654856.1 TIGR02234 family membrane protein [Mycobacteroides abscessus]MDM2665232.1 TIGR02234 family membrane protein [Mycobacteroides abscessus]MDM2670378.1 TIGR02234 family membrane protein [Mycobacteroides abscessus]MDM2675269.1 TIGR02234 family membrane protein [Mycobacteroides abscessus]
MSDPAPPNPGRRSLLMGAGLLVIAAGALWVASKFSWVRLRSFDGLGEPRTLMVSGADWSAALVPLAVALVAAAIATLAVRGWALRVLAVLVAIIGAAAAYLGVSLWAVRDVGPRAAEVKNVAVSTLVGADRLSGGATTAVLAAVVSVLAAITLLRAARGASASKYQTPAARRSEAVSPVDRGQSERVMWDSLDDGHDPTVGPAQT